MPHIEIALPAVIGGEVLIRSDAHAGRVGPVVAWRVVRTRFLAGGLLDGKHQVSLLVLTEQGDELWLGEGEVASFGARDVVSVFLPFSGGDMVLVAPVRAQAEIRGWQITGRRLGVEVLYRVHVIGTPAGEEIMVDVSGLELQG